MEIFGIIGHFTNKEGTLQALLLVLVEIERVLSREQLATHMIIVFDEYYIKDRLDYFIMDTTTTNNYMVSSILDQFFETDKVSYNT